MRIKLDIPLRISEIAEILSTGLDSVSEDLTITYISTDTRELYAGDLFIPLSGKNFDGEDFVENALATGAVSLTKRKTGKCLKVRDSSEALLKIAKLYKSKLKKLKSTIAITGSVGKSTTKNFLETIMKRAFNVSATLGNYNNLIGVCVSILSADRDTEILILEMGMNHRGEISILSNAFTPDLAIITNIGTSHIGNLGSREEIAKAKLEILDGMKDKNIIIPYREPLLSTEGAKSFSSTDKGADFYIENNFGKASFHGKDRWILDADFAPKERHLLDCLAPAITAALLSGEPTRLIARGIKDITLDSVSGHFRRIKNFVLYEDCYNASLESINADFDFISKQSLYKVKSAFIGSVMELGDLNEKIHFEIGRSAAVHNFKNIYFFGEHAEIMKEGALSEGFSAEAMVTIPNSDGHITAADEILKRVENGELILLKGSRAMKLEKISEILEKRNYHA